MNVRDLFTVLILSSVLGGCGSGLSGASPDLEQAVRAVRHMTAPNQLSRSAFSAAYENGTPSQYVSFLFSDLGAAEWPVATSADEAEAMRAARIPVFPDTVLLTRDISASQAKPQLVIRGDDRTGMVVVEGYERSGNGPVLREEWALPKVSPAVGVREIFEDQGRLGARYN
jgi:hypothetical protein